MRLDDLHPDDTPTDVMACLELAVSVAEKSDRSRMANEAGTDQWVRQMDNNAAKLGGGRSAQAKKKWEHYRKLRHQLEADGLSCDASFAQVCRQVKADGHQHTPKYISQKLTQSR